jgi:hypothetical protein
MKFPSTERMLRHRAKMQRRHEAARYASTDIFTFIAMAYTQPRFLSPRYCWVKSQIDYGKSLYLSKVSTSNEKPKMDTHP